MGGEHPAQVRRGGRQSRPRPQSAPNSPPPPRVRAAPPPPAATAPISAAPMPARASRGGRRPPRPHPSGEEGQHFLPGLHVEGDPVQRGGGVKGPGQCERSTETRRQQGRASLGVHPSPPESLLWQQLRRRDPRVSSSVASIPSGRSSPTSTARRRSWSWRWMATVTTWAIGRCRDARPRRLAARAGLRVVRFTRGRRDEGRRFGGYGDHECGTG